jgi:hypothetical protein
LVNLKPKSAADGYPMKVKEKTVLRFLGSRTFSHGLDLYLTYLYLTYSLIGALAERLNERLPSRSRRPLEGGTRFSLDREPLAAPFHHCATQHGDVAETRLLERDRCLCRARLRSAAEHHLLLLELIEVADAPRKLGDRDVFGPPLTSSPLNSSGPRKSMIMSAAPLPIRSGNCAASSQVKE